MGLYPRRVEGSQLQGEYLPGSTPVILDQCFLAHYSVAPVVADVDRLLAGQVTSNTAVTVVTTFLAQPDVPRVISATPGGTTASVPAGDITVVGKDINDNDITDVITFAADATTIQSTTKAFKSVSSITFPQQDGAGATYNVGVNTAIGLPHRLKAGTLALVKLFDGATDAGTVTANNTDVAKNLYAAAGTLNGVKLVDIYYLAT